MANVPTAEQLQFLNSVRDDIAANATEKGFRDQMRDGLSDEQWDGKPGQLIRAAVFSMNQVGEQSEFWEAFRAGTLDAPCDKAHKMEALGLPGLTCAEEEIADGIIRLFDMAHQFEVDIARAISALHGGKKA
jgi:hypothetical protein